MIYTITFNPALDYIVKMDDFILLMYFLDVYFFILSPHRKNYNKYIISIFLS